MDCHDLAAADAELLVHLPCVLLLTLDQLPHPARVPAALEVDGEDEAVEEKHEADAEEHDEVGLSGGEEGGGGEGDPREGSEVVVGQPHVGHVQPQGEHDDRDEEYDRPELGVGGQFEGDDHDDRGETR